MLLAIFNFKRERIRRGEGIVSRLVYRLLEVSFLTVNSLIKRFGEIL